MRFPGKHIQHRNAHISPVTYHLSNQSLAEESLRKAIQKKTLKGGFGTNCERKVKLLKSKVCVLFLLYPHGLHKLWRHVIEAPSCFFFKQKDTRL